MSTMASRCCYLSLFTVSARRANWIKLATLNYSRTTTATVNQSTKFYSSNSSSDDNNKNESQNNRSKSTDSGKQEKTNKAKYIRWAGVAAGGLLVTAAVPVVVVALGYGAGGVVAGSIAAGMQSATAGTMLAGGVSALQSIGAAGLTFSQGAVTTGAAAAGLNKLLKLRPKKKTQNSSGMSSKGEENNSNTKPDNKNKGNGPSM